ncbi:MAG: L-serine ammonia-lyase, iron-sulfur-dependent subunit beta [Eubacteriales bacterium]|nr:L-serine ammonia-lyase, iron-sulfur-dependent subunit beta [Eubacteriales bacterium]
MMQNSIFNVLGPVMIGPSSSHTAGAQRLGRAGYMVANGDIKDVRFRLHGSFAKTCQGHGTDKALVGGILGMQPWDSNIKFSHKIAQEKGVTFSFEEADLGDVHPNTVAMDITKSDGTKLFIMGSSIGGGSIKIININGLSCDITGDYPAVIVNHLDKLGMVSTITKILAEHSINIVSLKNNRSGKGEVASTIIETDDKIPEICIKQIVGIKDVLNCQTMERL